MVTGPPSYDASPAVGRASPPTSESSVVLPEPDEPVTASIRPGSAGEGHVVEDPAAVDVEAEAAADEQTAPPP